MHIMLFKTLSLFDESYIGFRYKCRVYLYPLYYKICKNVTLLSENDVYYSILFSLFIILTFIEHIM